MSDARSDALSSRRVPRFLEVSVMAKQKANDALLNVEAVTAILGDTSEARPMLRTKIGKPADFGGSVKDWRKSLTATIPHMVDSGMLVDGGTRTGVYLTGKKASKPRAAKAKEAFMPDTKAFPWSKGMSKKYFQECRDYWNYVKPRLAGWGFNSKVTENVWLGKWIELSTEGGINQKKCVRLLLADGFQGKKYGVKDFDSSEVVHDSFAAWEIEQKRINEHVKDGKKLSTLKPSKPIPIAIRKKAEKETPKAKAKVAKKTGKKNGKAKAKARKKATAKAS